MIVQPGLRPGLSWGAIFAGSLVAIGTWFLLHTLALGIGMTAIEPDTPSSLRGAGLGTGIGALLVPLISLFVGGMIAGRVAGSLTKSNAAIHAAVVWAIATIASIMMVVMLVSSLIGGATRAAGSAVEQAGKMMPGGGGSAMHALGLDSEQLLAPTNRRRAAQDRPPVAAAEVEIIIGDAMQTAIAEGQVDRDRLARSLTEGTEINRPDANEIADQVARRFDDRGSQARDVAERAGETALQGAEATGKAMLALFATMLLSLGTAILGSLLAANRQYHGIERRTTPSYRDTSIIRPSSPPSSSPPPTAP